MLIREPSSPLRRWVRQVWATTPGSVGTGASFREAVLPTGAMHLAIRLSGSALRVYGGPSRRDPLFTGHAVVGGARQNYYVRDLADTGCSVGAVLRLNAGVRLFGMPATELAERHTDLADLWGRDAEHLREQLAGMSHPADRLARFESALLERLYPVRRIDGSVLSESLLHFALRQWETGSSVAAVVGESGYSHRHFVDQFRRAVGLSPKAWRRVHRFQRALQSVASGSTGFCDIAYACGYSDQAHFSRDFRHFTGLTPTAYRQIAPTQPNHVPLPLIVTA